MRALTAFLACAVACLQLPVSGEEPDRNSVPRDPSKTATTDADKHYNEQIRPFLVRHCLGCHRGEKPKGDFRIDQLLPDFAGAASRDQWLTVLKRVQAGEMPPPAKPRPAATDLRSLVDWVSAAVAAADATQRAVHGRVVLRRLNRVEYENTVRDLLGIEVPLKEQLPPDSSADGFDNVGAALHTSSFLLEQYLEAADKALNVAIANAPKPKTVQKRYSLKDTHQVRTTRESVFRIIGETVVCFSSSLWQSVPFSPFYPAEQGRYRFRISASGFQSAGKPVTFSVSAGSERKSGKNGLIDYFDALADQPTIIEFERLMEPRFSISILPYGLAESRAVSPIGADKYGGPGLAVHWVEVEGPLHDTWPPESHRRAFGDLPQGPAPTFNIRNRVEVVSNQPLPDAERILRTFARRALRRSVTDDDLRPFVAIVQARLSEKYSFEQAVRVGLKAMMVSPEFLFLREKPGRLDDFALAGRLSYFLWSSMPDDELLTLAEQEKLSQPEPLRQQVERMLQDPKAAAFTENFVGQWLALRDIDFTEPSHRLYPEFDAMLKVSMVRETELFFTELLKDDLSLANFVASDFTMLNGRLAKHYGIPGVEGWAFRKVKLPPDSHRGGLLTMASVLKVTANGTTTSPVTRGAWVLDRLLGTPPPKPPPDVPSVVPDIRGATTIRQQLAKHRSVATCAACHAKIDPPGFALESFDVIGGWREYYRASGNGKPVLVDGRKMPYLQGLKVDPTDVFQGQPFRDIDEFKQLLLKDKDQLARSLATKLLTYATGGAPAPADQPAIEAIVQKVRDHNYGFRTLVQAIVQSQAFQNK